MEYLLITCATNATGAKSVRKAHTMNWRAVDFFFMRHKFDNYLK